MTKKLWSVITLFILLPFINYAQKKQVDNVVEFYMNNVQAIVDKGHVKGYYFFYKIDKVDRDESTFGLEIYNDKLERTEYREFRFPTRTKLFKVEFNGKNFCFQFFNDRERQYEFILYNEKLKETGKFKIEVSKSMAEDIAMQGSGIYHRLVSLPGAGFGVVGNNSKTNKWELTAYTAEGAELWKTFSGNSENLKFEGVMVIGCTSKYLVLFENYYKKLMKYNESSRVIRLIDLATGQEHKKIPINTDENVVLYDKILKTGDDYIIIGGFSNRKDPAKTGQSLMRINSEGEVMIQKDASLTADILSRADDSQTKKILSDKIVAISEAVRVDNANFLVGNLYESKNYSKIIGNHNSSGVLILKTDDDLGIKEWRLVKNKNEGGSRNYILFTSVNEIQKSFTVVYGDKYDDNNDLYFGSEIYKDGKFSKGDLKVVSRPTEYRILQAKPGYIAIFEYFKSEKRINLRLEKF